MSVIINSYTQALSKVILSAVDLTNKTVDYYLPPSDQEIEESIANDSNPDQTADDAETLRNVIRKVGALSNKMRVRVTREASSKLQSLSQKGHETLDTVKNTFDLVKHTKVVEELVRQSLSTISTHPTKTLAKLAVAAVDLADKTVEYYLPASDEELAEIEKNGEQENNDSIPDQEPVDAETVRNVIRRAGNLSNKVRLRVTRQASSRLQSLQKRGYDTFEQVRSHLDLVKCAKALEDTVRASLSYLPDFTTKALSKMALSAFDFADKTFEHYLPHSGEKKEKEKEKEKDC
uniref:Perilipin n=1 Tax=Tetranychus urticae TaxID=32264 RepID=T1JUP8_TETUR